MTKRISFVVFFFLIFQIGFSQSNTKNDIKNFNIEFKKILLNLDSVIINAKNHNETVEIHYNYVKNKIFKNELPITFDSTLKYDFLGCASFEISRANSKDVSLSYGQFLVDKYKNYPGLVYAIIINTFQSAYDYYNYQDAFLISTNNNIEKTYFQMDATTLETIFLDVYMKNTTKMGYFEKFLIEDLPNNLSNCSILFLRTDLEMLHKMDKIKNQEKNADILLKEFNDLGNDLIKQVNFKSDSKWINYSAIITLKTYVFYSQQVIFDIVHLKNGVSINLFKLNNYSENLKTIKQIQSVIKENNKYLSYHQETLKLFIESYNK